NERPEASTAWGFRFIRSPFASSPPFASSSLETRANADDGTSPSSLRDAGQVASGLFDIALVLEHQGQGEGDQPLRRHVRVERRQALRPIQRLADRGRLLQIEGANLADRVYHLLRQFLRDLRQARADDLKLALAGGEVDVEVQAAPLEGVGQLARI